MSESGLEANSQKGSLAAEQQQYYTMMHRPHANALSSPSAPLCSQIHAPCEARGGCFLDVFVNSLFMALLFWRHVANGTCWQEVREHVYLVACNFLGKQSVCNHLPPLYPVLPAGHPEARRNFILEKWWQVLSVTSGARQAGYYGIELTFHTQKCSPRESQAPVTRGSDV